MSGDAIERRLRETVASGTAGLASSMDHIAAACPDNIRVVLAELDRLRHQLAEQDRFHGSLTSVIERAGKRALADRDELGRAVRTAWMEWARTQPNPKPSWLVPYSQLSEADQEADRQIGEHIAFLVGAGWAREVAALHQQLAAALERAQG